MERNALVGWLLGGGGIVIAIVALIVAMGAGGGDGSAAAPVDISGVTADVAALNSDADALASQVSDLQAALGEARADADARISALEGVSVSATEIQGMVEDAVAAAHDEDVAPLEDALSDVREMAEGNAADLKKGAADVGALIAAHMEDHQTSEDAAAEALGAHELYHTALETALEAAIVALDDSWNTGDTGADVDAEIVAGLMERLEWLEQAAAPAVTQAYVEEAMRLFDEEGAQAAFDYYNTMDSVSGDLYLFVLDSDYELVVHPTVPHTIGTDLRGPAGTDITGKNFGAEFVTADEDGKWVDYVYLNPSDDFAHERKHSWVVRHQNYVFGSGWYERDADISRDPPAYARALVEQAIARYGAGGRDAIAETYNSPESVDGQWYVFIVDDDDTFLAHAATPARVGTDVKVLRDANGYAHGQAISEATEAGGWLEYTRVNPATGLDQAKRSWVIRHDGLVFGSGYYTDEPVSATPPENPAQATQNYVQAAIARYNDEGREAALAYYNTADSVDGDFYLFVLEDGEILAHATVPDNIGRSVLGPRGIDITGYDFGSVMAEATEAGEWVDYVYLNPAANFAYERKHSWLVRHDGLVFGSGWYERNVELSREPEAYTRALVSQAIARYDAQGRAAIADYYNKPESVDGQWYVFIVDKDDTFLAHAATPERVGTDVKVLRDANGYAHGQAISEATEEGVWLEYTRVNPATGLDQPKRSWVIRHDGLIFGSGWYTE